MTTVEGSDAGFLGSELRRVREAAGLSQAELAAKFNVDRTVIAKAESGRRPPTPDVQAAYAAEFPELDQLVASGLVERWATYVRKNGGTTFPRSFGKWVDAEREASSLFFWAPILVPGVFQTEAYARAMLATEPSDEPLDERVADRMSRREAMSRAHVSAVIAEAVLHRGVGGRDVMRDQLAYLLEVSQYPRVVIQVIPAEVAAHAGLGGAVSIAEPENGRTIVYLDSLTSGQTTGEPEIVAKVREMTGELRGDALSKQQSRDLIQRVAEQEWNIQTS